MRVGLADLEAFVAVAQAGGFRDAARVSGISASGLSEAVRRLETRLGVRLLHRTTRSVTTTEAGERLLGRLGPALGEVEEALDVVNAFRDRPAGTLRLNVAVSAARLILPAHRAGFPRRLSRDPPRGHDGGELRRRAGGGLRRRHPLRRAARAGRHRGADRPARPALRRRGLPGLSRPLRPPRAPARPPLPCLPAQPLRQRRRPLRGSSNATARC